MKFVPVDQVDPKNTAPIEAPPALGS